MSALLLLAMMQVADTTITLDIPVRLPQPRVEVEVSPLPVEIHLEGIAEVAARMDSLTAAVSRAEVALRPNDGGFWRDVDGVLGSGTFRNVSIIVGALIVANAIRKARHNTNVTVQPADIDVIVPPHEHETVPDHGHFPPGPPDGRPRKPGG